MYMRLLQIMVNPDFEMQFQHFYQFTVIPELQNLEGCQLVNLIKASNQPGEFISLTLWEEKQQAEQYVKSNVYKKLSEEIKPFLSQSNEWKVQLSEDLQLEYKPSSKSTTVRDYVVALQTSPDRSSLKEENDLFVRIVSVKIQEGKVDEFKDIYSSEIMPALQASKGCLYAFLNENLKEMDEFLSVSIWKSKADADEYENSGKFDELTNKVKHTFSHFYLWKMALEQKTEGKIRTSEDMKIDHYTMIAGKSFN
jgi:quinol monooxygenase YgiN